MTLARALEALSAAPASLDLDPLAFPRRWSRPADQEVMAVLAASLAFGRVRGFWPVLEALDAQAARHGGPEAWLRGFDGSRGDALLGLQHRWVRGPDLALWCATLGRALREEGSLGALATSAWRAEHAHIGPMLDAMVLRLREHALAVAPALGLEVDRFEQLPRGFRGLLCRPSDGSACKRWCMALRWLVRTDGFDLGLWALPTSMLVIPLDTHVARLSWFLGLTTRTDGSWRTALEVTRALAVIDPTDPLRFDFALAHLGIDGRCTVQADDPKPPPAEVCAGCPLGAVCRVNLGRADRPPAG